MKARAMLIAVVCFMLAIPWAVGQHQTDAPLSHTGPMTESESEDRNPKASNPDTTSYSSLSNTDHSDQHMFPLPNRRTFELATPFDAVNAECNAQCFGRAFVESATMAPYLNPCAACLLPDEYCGQQCRSCCHGGASSLKLAWHACPGTLSLASDDDFEIDCGRSKPVSLANRDGDSRFIPCECYDTMISRYLQGKEQSMDCAMSPTYDIPQDTCERHEICIVSIAKHTQLGMIVGDETVHWTVDLAKPLPPIIGIVLEPSSQSPNDTENASPSPPNRIDTYIDTSCFGSPVVNPVFPGYGKFLHSCPNMAFIDLKHPGKPPLPNSIDHFDGEPPHDTFWIEFLDGTSTGFWPAKEGNESAFYLNPTFAICACQQCIDFNVILPLNQSSEVPAQDRDRPPAAEQTASPSTSIEPSIAIKDKIEAPQEMQCAQYAAANCRIVGSEPGDESPCIYEDASRSLEEMIKVLQGDDKDRINNIVLEWYETGQISKNWISKEISRHREALDVIDDSQMHNAV
jgi:hypothetical protein